jgi:Na+/H+ antiporter NhaA
MLVCGVLGLVAGFVRGLFVYVPTAWAAAFEGGIPATAAGVVIGLAIAGARSLARRLRTPSA